VSDWPALLRLAARLHVPPDAFWRLSVAEWRAITAPPPSDAMGRRALNALMAAWPDGRPCAPDPLTARTDAWAPPLPGGERDDCAKPLAPAGRGRGPHAAGVWEGEGNRSATP
jgi:uncharacterized phage protein (TIGR02216 family)